MLYSAGYVTCEILDLAGSLLTMFEDTFFVYYNPVFILLN